MNPIVGIVMGSQSDLDIMRSAQDALMEFNIHSELTIVSAHRTPDRLMTYAKTAVDRGIKVIIAGAGGAAHLPGMIAAVTPLPVIGVPIRSSNSIDGWDSLLSIVQMPNGVPVATVAINGAFNAGLLAAQMLSTGNPLLIEKIFQYKTELQEKVMETIRSHQLGDPLDSLPH